MSEPRIDRLEDEIGGVSGAPRADDHPRSQKKWYKDRKYRLSLVGIVVPIVLAVIGWILYPSSSHRNSLINIGGNIGIQTQGQVGNNTTNNNFISPHHFSETQSIKILPPSLGGIDTLNLDNIATLKAWFNTHFGITLLLDTPAIAFPPKIGIEGAEVWQRDGKQYVFDLVNNQEQEVIVSGRTFIIKLRKIKTLDVPGVVAPALEYVFGISDK